MTVWSNNEPGLFGEGAIDLSSLSVAQENYYASKPPIRNLNVTGEILNMLRSRKTQQSLEQVFAEANLEGSDRLAYLTSIRRF